MSLKDASLSTKVDGASSGIEPSFTGFSSITVLVLPPVVIDIVVASGAVVIRCLVLGGRPREMQIFL